MRRFRSLSCLALLSFMLIACEDDFVTEDPAAFDVTVENVEPTINESTTALFLMGQYVPFFDALRPGVFVPDNLSVASTNTYQVPCENSGYKRYQLSKSIEPIDENTPLNSRQVQFRNGDSIDVDFDDCLSDSGVLIDGQMTLTYSDIQGLNRRFDHQDASSCTYFVRQDMGSSDIPLIENRVDGASGDDGYFKADGIRFERLQEGLRYTYYENVVNQAGDVIDTEDVDTGLVLEPSIIVLRKVSVVDESAIPREFVLDPTGVPNTGVERVYRIDYEFNLNDFLDQPNGSEDADSARASLASQLQLCQSYERFFRTSFSGLGVYLPEGMLVSKAEFPVTNITLPTSVLFYLSKGSITLSQASFDLQTFSEVLNNSSFRVESYLSIPPNITLVEGFGPIVEPFVPSVYTYFDFTMREVNSLSHEGIRVLYNGDLEIEGGRFVVNSLIEGMSGLVGELPEQGSINYGGIGLEAIFLQLQQGPTFRSTVDYDGNRAGGEVSEFDYSFLTDWQSILDRNYVCREIEEVDGFEQCI